MDNLELAKLSRDIDAKYGETLNRLMNELAEKTAVSNHIEWNNIFGKITFDIGKDNYDYERKQAIKRLWHINGETPDPNRCVFIYDKEKNDYDLIYAAGAPKHPWIYLDDILLPDMVEALRRYEDELDESFT